MPSAEPATSEKQRPRRSWWQRIRRAIVLYIFVPYLFVTLAFFVFQRRLMYVPTVANDLRSASIGLDPTLVLDVAIQTPDGITINGWFLKQTREDHPTCTPLVIYFPGNASNRHGRIVDLQEFAACGFDVLIFDYRGYGDNHGSPSESVLSSDARLIWDFATKELDRNESEIVVFGESLGGAVALSLWSSRRSEESESPPQPAALMLNSAFSSMEEIAAWHFPAFPFRFMVLDPWRSNECIADVPCPIILFHGMEDSIVPVAHGRELAHLGQDTRLTEINGAGHNNIPIHRMKTELDRLRSAIDTAVKIENPPVGR